MNISLSVVLPAYNEEENIKKTIADCLGYLGGQFDDYEIIVINDGSSDNTAGETQKLIDSNNKVRLINHEINMGYGTALNTGLEAASMDFIFFMDSDGQFNISELEKLIPYLAENHIVIGYRIKRADNIIRTLNAYLYGLYIRLFFGLNVKDIDCAFKIFPRSAFDTVKPIMSRGALYSAELLIKFKRMEYEINEVGVSHYPRSHGEQSGANLSVIFKMFRESWKFRNELLR